MSAFIQKKSISLLCLMIAMLFISCGSSKKRASSRGGGYKSPYKIAPKTMGSTDDNTTANSPETTEDTKEVVEEAPSEVSKMAKRAVKIEKVLSVADSYMGTKHKMGGQSKSGIDCSGLVQISYKSINVSLPRSTSSQINSGNTIAIDKIVKGDLLFFTYPGGNKVTHVGIVYEVGSSKNVTFIHTSSSRGVRKDNLYSDYWRKLFVRAKRVL